MIDGHMDAYGGWMGRRMGRRIEQRGFGGPGLIDTLLPGRLIIFPYLFRLDYIRKSCVFLSE